MILPVEGALLYQTLADKGLREEFFAEFNFAIHIEKFRSRGIFLCRKVNFQ